MNKLKIFGMKGSHAVRTLAEMKKVIYDQKWLKKERLNLEIPLYYVYQGLSKNKNDKKTFKKFWLSYDVTIIPPRLLGKEFVKTKGHYHPLFSKKLSYPEIYEVLDGKAIFLLQQKNKISNIKNVIAIKVKKDEKIIIPPNYGHIIINVANKTLKTANIISNKFFPVYDEVEKKNGFCYFAIKEKSGIKWIKNKKYKKVPGLRFKKPGIFSEFQISKSKSLYNLIKTPFVLDFLNKPQNYSKIWKKF